MRLINLSADLNITNRTLPTELTFGGSPNYSLNFLLLIKTQDIKLPAAALSHKEAIAHVSVALLEYLLASCRSS
jgi:hypothetical protein